MHVLLITGGNSKEREISLRSAETIKQAVKQAGYGVTIIDLRAGTAAVLKHAKEADVAWIMVHGAGGEDGSLQKLFEKEAIPYVGSNSSASQICFDKWRYKKYLAEAGLPVSEGALVTVRDIGHPFFTKPFVLKPLQEGSSIDTLIVRHKPTVKDIEAAKQLFTQYQKLLLEPLVQGTEVTVGMLLDDCLPLIEIIPPADGEFDFDNKYNGKSQELCPPQHVSDTAQQAAIEAARAAHKRTGCRHYSRTDIIIGKDDTMHILETNTIPGMTEASLLPKMITTHGLTLSEACDRLLQDCVKK